MTHTQTHAPATSHHARPARLVRWSGGIGALGLAGLSIAHLVVNSIGFAGHPDPDWLLFLAFGIGVSILAAGLAVLTWRYAVQGHGRLGSRVLVGVAGLLCCYTLVTVLQRHPEVIFVPMGPGPWSLIGGPALLLTALLSRKPSSR